ncbi:MAG: DNA-processing protein DprA [Chitinophagales bacterium]|nr:DNA-processing protein DprA [Chitinophagales bacterium]MDW8417942.1 DNA-processing protein DprA [Chitinophagales bacterium]
MSEDARREELLYRMALTMIGGIGPALAKNLLAYCGSARKVFNTPRGKLEKVPGIGKERAERIAQSDALQRAEQELKFIEKHRIDVLFIGDTSYPQRLLECADAPILLYYKGCANLNANKVVAIVGTRRATEYGKELTRRIAEELSAHGVMIISGLAYGIDTVAHQAAVEAGAITVGVLGHGLNTIYPRQNRNLAKRMLEKGGLLTEYASSDVMRPENFAERNRIVAGMSDCVIVVESGQDGGALITANIANAYHRKVFALPGRVHDKFSRGCHALIRTNRAVLIESAEDVMRAMQWSGKETGTAAAPPPRQLALQLGEEETRVHRALQQHGETHIDTLAEATGLNPSVLASVLLEMELNGWVVSLPGKRFKLAT